MPGKLWPNSIDRLARVSWIGGVEVERLRRSPDFDPQVQSKTRGELVSQIDRAASDKMTAEWEVQFPGVPRIDEEDNHETGPTVDQILAELNAGGNPYGYVDPADGTTAILNALGAPEYAPPGAYGNTVALAKSGIVQGGVINQMAFRQLFCAAKGEGCWWFAGPAYDHFWATGELVGGRQFEIAKFGPPQSPTKPLMISGPSSGKMVEGDFDRWMQIRWKLWEHGLLANELAAGCAVGNTVNVLFGRCTYFNVGGGVAWDLAAAGLCVEEAGGSATTTDGKPLVWEKLKLPVIFAPDHVSAKRLLEVFE